ncbi:ATP-binding cassette domain-containing protein [Gordonia sp. NPDC003585]|uniref:ATP-binding cassette domain-containing protein n=1 Tax=Gordonia sp. NPDC003585 TaxID=3154275 RepID=UPI0033A347C5
MRSARGFTHPAGTRRGAGRAQRRPRSFAGEEAEVSGGRHRAPEAQAWAPEAQAWAPETPAWALAPAMPPVAQVATTSPWRVYVQPTEHRAPRHAAADAPAPAEPRSTPVLTETPLLTGSPVNGTELPTSSIASAPLRESATPSIEVVGVRKVFGDHVAVDDVSFTAERGTILGLLGPNGAGKTTTVNMLCTLLKPDAGHARVNGYDVVSDAAAVRRSIMLTGQFAALDEALTGRENLVLFGRLLGLSKSAASARADELLESFALTDAASRRVREYSGGMRRRIDIACGLVTAPAVVFLDEPTTGLDPRSRQEVWRLVEGLRDQGVTTLLTTQYLEEADVLSDRIVLIDHGRVIADGTAAELKAGIGTSFYEVTPRDPEQVSQLFDILADLGATRAASDDPDESHAGDVSVTVPAPDGTEALIEIVRRTTDSGISLSDVALRTPTLDEVFLALTADKSP